MPPYLDIYAIRRRRLQGLIARYKQETGVGAQEVARRSGLPPQHISGYASEHSKKPLGPQVARQIEKGCGLPAGWLDSLDEAQGALEMVERVLEQIPPEAWNPLTRSLVVKIADMALKEQWDEPTLRDKVAEYLRLVG